MCGLFGFSCYGNEPVKNLSVLTNSLAEHSAVRGTDATGIAFCRNGIQIQKEAKSAYIELQASGQHPCIDRSHTSCNTWRCKKESE